MLLFFNSVSSFRELLSFVDLFLGLLVVNFWKKFKDEISRKHQQFNKLFSRIHRTTCVIMLRNF